jgi:ubiquinone/menaquinone biosynthesis C-methylase UbiE
MDTYEPAIAQLKKETETSNITAIAGDITKPTNMDNSSIDLIYLSTVFHGFTDSQKAGFLNETKRILKPEGILAVVEISKTDTPFGPPMNLKFSPEELIASINLKPKALTRIGNFFYMQTFIN